MEALKKAAKDVLAWRDDVRKCNRLAVQLANAVLALPDPAKPLSSEKSTPGALKEPEKVEIPASEPKKAGKSRKSAN